MDIELLEFIVHCCEQVASRWNDVEEQCQGFAPRTFVHGDFVSKNMRVQNGVDGSALLLFDWSTVGWGSPAVDLGALVFEWEPIESVPIQGVASSVSPATYAFLESYLGVVQGHWRSVSMQAITKLARVGTLLRCLAALDWETEGLAYARPCEPMSNMNCYAAKLSALMKA